MSARELKGIVGLHLPITRLEGKRKLSQNRPEADRVGVVEGLAQSEREGDRAVAGMMTMVEMRQASKRQQRSRRD